MTAIAEIQKWSHWLAEQPTAPSGIRVHREVPRGCAYRQWDTHGRLWIWVNKADIDSLPRRRAEQRAIYGDACGVSVGIPIYDETLVTSL